MKMRKIALELGHHLPYSIFFTAAGFVLAGLMTYAAMIAGAEKADTVSCHECDYVLESEAVSAGHVTDEHKHENHHDHDEDCDHGHTHGRIGEDVEIMPLASGMMFHLFHPIHLLLSAMATTAMFFRHERRLLKAIIVGIIGSLGVCGISDIFLPFLSGELLELGHMHFHWCLIAHPQMVLPFVVLGVFSGLLAARVVHHSTVISHSAHIFISCAATLFYLISYGVTDWYGENKLGLIFAIVIVAVTIPCCMSDIVLPLLVIRGDGDEDCDFCGHHHADAHNGESGGD